MLPEGWHRSTLGDIARISSGGTPDRVEPSYWGGSIPWVTTGEIQFNTITGTTEKITEAGLKYSSAKLFPTGTLLMAMYGQGKTRGQVAKLGIEAATNQACAAILLNKAYDSDFFFQYLSSQYTAVRKLGNAGTQKNLSGGILKEVLVPVPPLPEQRRIARILTTWDQAIITTERLLDNCRRQQQALIQKLLMSGLASKNWSTVQIHRIADRVTRRVEVGAKSYPILMISSSTGFLRQDEQYSRYMAGKSVENYVLLHQGEFAYNKGNSKRYEFGCVFPLENYEQGLVPHVYVCFSLRKHCDPTFYKYLFAADYLHDQLGALVNTGVRNNGLLNIRPADFMGVKVPLPPLKDQRRIAAILQTASDEIACLERDLNALLRLV
jgi:type I restriction enzyme S subunit